MKNKEFSFRVLSYNIHKGFTSNSKFSLHHIRSSIRTTHADIVCLQEIIGENQKYKLKILDWPSQSQLEFLADEIWPHFSYGQNAVYSIGDHGNALMSKFQVDETKELNLTTNRFEKRGLLYAQILLPGLTEKIHVMCVHLDLFGRGRMKQIKKIVEFTNQLPDQNSPLLICGDFNDWTGKAGNLLEQELNVKEAFKELNGSYAKTFPVRNPLLTLDRIYYRHLVVGSAESFYKDEWKSRSDHAALCANFKIIF